MINVIEDLIRIILIFLFLIHLIGALWVGTFHSTEHNFVSTLLLICMLILIIIPYQSSKQYIYRVILGTGIISTIYLIYEALYIIDDIYKFYLFESILFIVLMITSIIPQKNIKRKEY